MKLRWLYYYTTILVYLILSAALTRASSARIALRAITYRIIATKGSAAAMPGENSPYGNTLPNIT